MGIKYTLTVNSNSNNYRNICVYQALPDQPDNLLTLAWFSKAAHPGTTVEVEFDTDVYSKVVTLKDDNTWKV